MGAAGEALAPGEEVRFEGAARGWPSSSLEALALHATGLVPVLLVTAAGGLATLAGQTIDVSVSGLWRSSTPRAPRRSPLIGPGEIRTRNPHGVSVMR
jgi:hypothetical protein